jgi:hypothetical protein
LYGCYLKEVNYGDANYGTSEAMTIALSIAYDNASQTANGGVPGGVGTLGSIIQSSLTTISGTGGTQGA